MKKNARNAKVREELAKLRQLKSIYRPELITDKRLNYQERAKRRKKAECQEICMCACI
jgi:hypothetical protein